jgi:dihydroneopterin aldolase
MADTREVSFWEAKAAAGEPVAAVRIKNLQSSIVGPPDAWGRPGKQQPVLVSVDIHFRDAFDSSSARDQLNADTVHYGQLSKAILEVIVPVSHQQEVQGSYIEVDRSSLRFHSGLLWRRLTGIHPLNPNGRDAGPPEPVLININRLAYMCITLRLPKASLLGEAITFSEALCLKNDLLTQFPPILYNSCLRIHRLRVPTLVGVNSNERQMKQAVVVDVAVDGVVGTSDFYPVLESLTVKVGKLGIDRPTSS